TRTRTGATCRQPCHLWLRSPVSGHRETSFHADRSCRSLIAAAVVSLSYTEDLSGRALAADGDRIGRLALDGDDEHPDRFPARDAGRGDRGITRTTARPVDATSSGHVRIGGPTAVAGVDRPCTGLTRPFQHGDPRRVPTHALG